jgi:hypothetical protein
VPGVRERSRCDDLIAIAVNAALVTFVGFCCLTGSVTGFALQGALAFAYVLEMWMLGDTLSTNVLGRDADRALSQLRDPAAMRQWLRANHIAFWTFVGPPCAIVALVIGIVRGVRGLRRGGAHSPDPAAGRVEHRRLDRYLGALSPPEAAVALTASFGLARSGNSVGVLAIVPFIVVPLMRFCSSRRA